MNPEHTDPERTALEQEPVFGVEVATTERQMTELVEAADDIEACQIARRFTRAELCALADQMYLDPWDLPYRNRSAADVVAREARR